MANITKRGDAWRVRLRVAGRVESGTFPTKAQAAAWAHQRTAEAGGERLPDKTVADALRRYAREVSPTHKGERWEVARLRMTERDALALVRLPGLRAVHVAEWRERRLLAVAGASVAREMTLLRCVFEVARREWGWLRDNPARDVRKPSSPPSRKRRITQGEIDQITSALGYDGGAPVNASQRIALAFLFALETAMRSGEICGLQWADIGAKSAQLPKTKNGDARAVPLSAAARAIVALLPRDDGPAFGLDDATRDTLFRRARDQTGIVDLHFHDTRAEAIFRLSKKLDVMELAKMIGHRDLRSLLIYYQTSADELADRLG